MKICYDGTNWVEKVYGHVQGIAFVNLNGWLAVHLSVTLV
jgi:hypothetical protein